MPFPGLSNLPQPRQIVTGGSIDLTHLQSFDFVSGSLGQVTGGDLYVGLDPTVDPSSCDGQDAFWANNVGQRGGVDLGAYDGDLSLVQPPQSVSAYDRFCVPIQVDHVYAYLQKDEGLVVVFRVVWHAEHENVALEYVVFEGP
jgi:hypothetical protein